VTCCHGAHEKRNELGNEGAVGDEDIQYEGRGRGPTGNLCAVDAGSVDVSILMWACCPESFVVFPASVNSANLKVIQQIWFKLAPGHRTSHIVFGKNL
jgi:hypothetical protein